MDYEALEDYFGFLHQDWGADHATVWDVLDSYLADLKMAGTVSRAAGIPSDVERLLAADPSEEQLAEACWKLGAYYVATWDGGTYRGWLTEISRRTDAWLRANAPHS